MDMVYEEHSSRDLWVPEGGLPGAQTLPRGVGGSTQEHLGSSQGSACAGSACAGIPQQDRDVQM